MAAKRSILVITLWVTCQLGAFAQLSFPAAIGSPCTADDRCNTFIPNGVCRDGACACADGYVAHPTSTTSCLPVAINLNDNCEEEIQCTEAFGQNALCSQQTCICKPDNHFVTPKQCIPNKELGEQCTESSECYLEDDGSSQNTECIEKQCKCRVGYEPTPENRSCKGSAATNIISITCLVGVWILHLVM